MKIQTTPSFVPVTFNITCESQDELDAFVTMFNNAMIDAALGQVWPNLGTSQYQAFPSIICNQARQKLSALTTALTKS